jgi:hypothetical protein
MIFLTNVYKSLEQINNINIIYPVILKNGLFIGFKYIKMLLNNKPPKKIVDPSYEYYQRVKQRYSASFEEFKNYNQNVSSIFYSKKEFQDFMKIESNYLEKEWRTRILIETTPRGNIIMFYDPYKQGFSYYCDSTCIPYNILNAVAMKYVITFYCRDFFVDNKIIEYLPLTSTITDHKQYESPLIKIHFTEEKPVKKTNNFYNNSIIKSKNYRKTDNRYIQPFGNLVGLKTRRSFLELMSNAFINIKNYLNIKVMQLLESLNIVAKKTVSNTIENDNKPEKEYNHNRFIQLGKISNFKFLQLPTKIHCLNGFESVHLENLKSETSLQKQVLNYSDFKKRMVTV